MSFTRSGALSYPFSREGKWALADRMNLAKRSELPCVDAYVVRDPVKMTARWFVSQHEALFTENKLKALRKWLRLRKMQRFARLPAIRRIQSDEFIQVLLYTVTIDSFTTISSFKQHCFNQYIKTLSQ